MLGVSALVPINRSFATELESTMHSNNIDSYSHSILAILLKRHDRQDFLITKFAYIFHRHPSRRAV